MNKLLIILTISILFFTALPGVEASEQKFKAEITFYQNESPEINSVEIVDTERVTIFREGEEHEVSLRTGDGETIFESSLAIMFEHIAHRGVNETTGEVMMERISTSNVTEEVFITVDNQASVLEVEDGNGVSNVSLTEVLCSLSGSCTEYCDHHDAEVVACTCGDGVCQPHENVELCPEDCETDTEVGVSSEDSIFRSYSIYILLGILAVLAAIYILKKIAEKEESNENPDRYNPNSSDLNR